MKTYRFYCRSTRRGFTQWAVAVEDGQEVCRIDRDVHMETVRQFRERAAQELEAKGFAPAPGQYTL
ncbi:MAG: hypothetical protein LUG57_04325 [Oscillospiraceae bacterium]|nr:hypothetical protein [Oscillospiraceae bacterium]